jgi:hypothetical protein
MKEGREKASTPPVQTCRRTFSDRAAIAVADGLIQRSNTTPNDVYWEKRFTRRVCLFYGEKMRKLWNSGTIPFCSDEARAEAGGGPGRSSAVTCVQSCLTMTWLNLQPYQMAETIL